MARLKEKQFDKNKWAEMLKIKQAEDKAVKEALRANKAAGLMISEGGKGGSPNKETPDWDKNWPKPGTAPRPEDRPNIPTKLASLDEPDSSIMRYVTEKGFFLDGQGRSYMQGGGKFQDAGEYDLDLHGLPVPLADARKGLMISHHTGGKHFTEPSMEELIDGLINGEIPRGTLGDEETENRLIQERQNQLQQQSLKINQNVAKTPSQQNATNMRELIKKLTKEGKHIEAQALYKEQFPRV